MTNTKDIKRIMRKKLERCYQDSDSRPSFLSIDYLLQESVKNGKAEKICPRGESEVIRYITKYLIKQPPIIVNSTYRPKQSGEYGGPYIYKVNATKEADFVSFENLLRERKIKFSVF